MRKLLSRQKELENIFRYEWSKPIWMHHRPNLFIHSKRVEWLSLEISNFLIKKTSKKLDIDLIREMARFHDDIEIIIWDYLAMDKEKFSEEEKLSYKNKSLDAINILYDNFWNISEKFNYKEILLNVENKEWIESFIVDFADKLDAHLEISHELFAWNKNFIAKLSHWWLDIWPFDYTINKILKIRENILNYFWNDFDLNWSFLDLSSNFDDIKIFENSKNHNLQNLQLDSWYHLYDNWIKLHFKYWNIEDINYLINKRA